MEITFDVDASDVLFGLDAMQVRISNDNSTAKP